MSTPTRSATSSLAKDSRFIMGSHAGARCRVDATPGATSVVVTSADELTGTSLYSASAPGQLEILSAAAGTTHHGKTANITAIVGTTLTVSVDFSAVLAAGDVIMVAPPPSVEAFLAPGGHTLNTALENDYTMGLTDTFDRHNTAMGARVEGDVSFFQTINSEFFLRALALGIGSYKTPSPGTHKFRPIEANDGTFTTLEDATIYAQDGNGVIRQAFFGLFGSALTLDYPENARGVGTLSLIGNGQGREIGGSGKTFTTGANNWIRSNFTCDTGPGLTFRAVGVEFGGAFGDGFTTAMETTIKNLTVRGERGSVQDRTLGDAWIVKPEETSFKVRVTGTRILQNDSIFEAASGKSTDAEAGNGAKTTTRMLIKAVSPDDATKTLTIDMPLGLYSTHNVRREGQSRFKEDFEFAMLATEDANGCISTTTPPVEITVVSSVTKNLATAL